MPVIVEVLMGRHFFVETPCCYTKFTYNGQEYATDTQKHVTNPKWEKNKFEVPYEGKPLSIDFDVMNRKSREESERIASVTVEWPHFIPGLRKVADYVVQAHVEGVKDTAAIRVAATLIPEGISGEPQRDQPNRKALFVGCQYRGPSHLPHCHEDAEKMKYYFVGTWGFSDSPENLKVLMDGEDIRPDLWPTRENIRSGISWLVRDAVAGDSLLFYYSGHGGNMPNPNDKEKDGFDEAIMPCDFLEAGSIVDDELNELLVQRLPEGVRLTCFLDCCHSGTAMDLPYRWSPYDEEGESGKWELDRGGFYAQADVICISAATDAETAANCSAMGGQQRGPESMGGRMPAGFFSAAFCVALAVHDTQVKMNWKEMLKIVKNVTRDKLGSGGHQSVQLSSSQKFDLTREFGFHDAIKNTNDKKGPVWATAPAAAVDAEADAEETWYQRHSDSMYNRAQWEWMKENKNFPMYMNMKMLYEQMKAAGATEQINRMFPPGYFDD